MTRICTTVLWYISHIIVSLGTKYLPETHIVEVDDGHTSHEPISCQTCIVLPENNLVDRPQSHTFNSKSICLVPLELLRVFTLGKVMFPAVSKSTIQSDVYVCVRSCPELIASVYFYRVIVLLRRLSRYFSYF